MSEIRELYQQMIIDHGRHPRNFGELKGANATKEGFNPLCGDKLTLYLKIEDNIVQDLMFEGVGCAISMASASLMTEALKGKTINEAKIIFEKFHLAVTTGIDKSNLGKLEVLTGVKDYPARVKCATLAWHTLVGVLDKDAPEIISTE